MNLKETQIDSTPLFQGCVLNLRKDRVMLPNGETAFREVIEHNGGACVAPLDDQGNLLMVRQHRYAAGETLWEIPAGKLEKGEDPMLCAARELEEEAGCIAKELIPLGYFFPTPAYCQEKIYMYYAKELTPTKQNLDEDEFLEVAAIPFDQVLKMVDNGEITDGKTQLAILKLKALLNK
ncbi:MAG: NUDIX hydrolase [Clostridia bacterium]|nr:NUDIX hydrolase [Clostridia bacterium]